MRVLTGYYSVEFSVKDLPQLYQFRIQGQGAGPVSILVKAESDVLPRLKVGESFHMKYYAEDQEEPEFRETMIKEIARAEEGRLRGHFVVTLEPSSARA